MDPKQFTRVVTLGFMLVVLAFVVRLVFMSRSQVRKVPYTEIQPPNPNIAPQKQETNTKSKTTAQAPPPKSITVNDKKYQETMALERARIKKIDEKNRQEYEKAMKKQKELLGLGPKDDLQKKMGDLMAVYIRLAGFDPSKKPAEIIQDLAGMNSPDWQELSYEDKGRRMRLAQERFNNPEIELKAYREVFPNTLATQIKEKEYAIRKKSEAPAGGPKVPTEIDQIQKEIQSDPKKYLKYLDAMEKMDPKNPDLKALLRAIQ